MASSTTAWRIVAARWAHTAFDGEGARRVGGRWNCPGRPAIYVAGSRALAALEILVHLNQWTHTTSFVRFPVVLPDHLVDRSLWDCPPPDLPSPHAIAALNPPPSTQNYGDLWLRRNAFPVLQVPSAIIPEEPNYLLNPLNPEFSSIHIGPPEPFSFNRRLLREV